MTDERNTVEIKLDETMIQKAIEEQIGAAVKSALGGYEVQKAVAGVISDEVAHGVIRDSLNSALKQLDHDALVGSLAKQIDRTVTSATVRILQDGFVEVIASLRKVSDYDSDRKSKLAAIRAELKMDTND